MPVCKDLDQTETPLDLFNGGAVVLADGSECPITEGMVQDGLHKRSYFNFYPPAHIIRNHTNEKQ